MQSFGRPRNLVSFAAKLDKTTRRHACCQPTEITGFPPDFNSLPCFITTSRVRGVPIQYGGKPKPDPIPKNSFTARPKTLFHFGTRRKIRRTPKRKTVQKLKIAWRLCFSRKPFREPCPRMRTPERGQLEVTEFDAKSHRDDSAGRSDTSSLVLDLIVIPK